MLHTCKPIEKHISHIIMYTYMTSYCDLVCSKASHPTRAAHIKSFSAFYSVHAKYSPEHQYVQLHMYAFK